MRRRRQQAAAVVLVVILTAGAGWVDGHLSNRWGKPRQLEAVIAQFDRIPQTFGPWDLETTEQLSDRVVDVLQCEAHFVGTYVHRRHGNRVAVALIAGPAGPTAVHTPEICYSSRNHQVIEAPTEVAIGTNDERSDSCWRMTLQSNSVEADRLRVYYGWATRDGPWEAARFPRFQYTGQPVLYKFQLASQLPRPAVALASAGDDSTSEVSDPGGEFLAAFVEELDRAGFRSTATARAASH